MEFGNYYNQEKNKIFEINKSTSYKFQITSYISLNEDNISIEKYYLRSSELEKQNN